MYVVQYITGSALPKPVLTENHSAESHIIKSHLVDSHLAESVLTESHPTESVSLQLNFVSFRGIVSDIFLSLPANIFYLHTL